METIQQWLFSKSTDEMIIAGVVLAAIVLLVKVMQRAISRRVKDADSRYRAKKITTFSGSLLAFIALLLIFSDRLGSVTVTLGVAGAGIALALQEVIASVAGWIVILFGNYFKTGDRVEFAGIKGDVIDIGVLRTTIMEIGGWVEGDLHNGRVVRISNNFIFKGPVFNYSGEFPFLWDEIVLPAKHGTDIPAAKKILSDAVRAAVGEFRSDATSAWQEISEKYMLNAADIEPTVTMSAGGSGLLFTVRYVVDFRKRRPAKDALYAAVLDTVKKNSKKIIFAGA